jgi:hypothetical protein
VSNLVVCLDPHRILHEVQRHLRIITVAVIVAFALHQWGSELVSCFLRSPDPIVCSPPDIILPHADNERPEPGQALDKALFTTVVSATSVTPCFNPGPKQRPR